MGETRRPITTTAVSAHAGIADAASIRPPNCSSISNQGKLPEALPRTKSTLPSGAYCAGIPHYLQALDRPDESPTYQNAEAFVNKLPGPPTLPDFLGKPILDAVYLVEGDDNVFNMPSHTVLNHLATTNIRDGILAVSATTRYMSKVRSFVG